MTQLLETPPLSPQRSRALADLIQALAAPGSPQLAHEAAAAIRQAFPAAAAVYLHRLRPGQKELTSLLDGAESPADAEPAEPLRSHPAVSRQPRPGAHDFPPLDAPALPPEASPPLAGSLSPAALAVLHRAARERTPQFESVPSGDGTRAETLAVVPLTHGERVLGTLALRLKAAAEWSEEDAASLLLLSQPVSLVLAQAQLDDTQQESERRYQEMSEAVESRAQARLEQLAGRGRQLEALFHLSSQIGKALDETKVTTMALDHLVALTSSRFGFVVTVNPAGALELGCVRGAEEAERAALRGALSGLRGLVNTVLIGQCALRHNQEAQLPVTADATPTASGSPPVRRALQLDSLLAVPLCSDNRPLGVLVLVGRLPGYDEADERLVSMFGLQVAVALQNARMLAKIEGSLETRHRELARLSRTAQDLASAADEAQVLQQVIAIVHETFEARAAWIMLRESDPRRAGGDRDRRATDGSPVNEAGTAASGGVLRLRIHHGAGPEPPAWVPLSDPGIVGDTLRRLEPVFKGNVEPPTPDDGAGGGTPDPGHTLPVPFAAGRIPTLPWGAPDAGTLLCVPLVVQDQALGVLGLDSARFSAWRPPLQQDLDLILAFASQAAVAIQNARLVEAAVRRTRRERLLNEIIDAVREPMGVDEILDRAVERLGAALEVSRCMALVPQENGEYREHVWTDPRFPLPSDAILWESCPLVQRLEQTGKTLAISRAAEIPELCKLPNDVAPPQSLLALPALARRGDGGTGGRGEGVRGGAGDRTTASSAGHPVAPSPRPPAPPAPPRSLVPSPRPTGGVLFMFHQCDEPREWSEEDLSLVQRVASQVAVAVENARLYEHELKQEQFQRTMAEIATAVGSSVELTEVLRAVGEQGMRLLNADGAYIWRLDEATRELVSAAAVGHKADRFQNLSLALTRRSFLVVRAAVERRPVAAHGLDSDRSVSQRLNRMFDCRSVLAVPLLLREKVIGVVQFSITQPSADFDEGQVAQAEILVSQAAAAVENAQLYEAERGRAEELEVLWRIGQEIAENLQPERIFTSIVAGARQVLAVEAASLMMFEEDDTTLSVTAAEGLSPEHVAAAHFRRAESIPRCVAVDGARRLTATLAEDPRYPAIAGQEGLQSMLSVPMQDGTQIAGALNVYSRRRRYFQVEEAQKLDVLASFAMAALRQARQFRREQKIAQAFQRDLLPELKLTMAGIDAAPKSIAALTTEADVGGDFYDVHPISDTRIALAIGDVSGKGLAAAPLRAMVKCVLRAFAFESPSPAPVLERLNRLLYRTMGVEQFVTLFYGVLDVNKGVLTYANAGHELPLVLRRGSGAPELLETTGPLLAVNGDSRYRQVCTPIDRGDTLVLYTDGFTEARKGSEFLQVEGLASLLGQFRDGTAGDMVESISRSVKSRYGSLRDDATIVVVKSIGTAHTGLAAGTAAGEKR